MEDGLQRINDKSKKISQDACNSPGDKRSWIKWWLCVEGKRGSEEVRELRIPRWTWVVEGRGAKRTTPRFPRAAWADGLHCPSEGRWGETSLEGTESSGDALMEWFQVSEQKFLVPATTKAVSASFSFTRGWLTTARGPNLGTVFIWPVS